MLPLGVEIRGQVFHVYDWKLYMSNPKAKRQIVALKALKKRIKEKNSA
jgi:hypothetical protein